jgi:hypothetical protein
MTLVRIARPHIRTLHAAITLISTMDGKAVLPRVVGVSGTVKKAQGRIIVYHRGVIAQMLARFDEGESILHTSYHWSTIGACPLPSVDKRSILMYRHDDGFCEGEK